MEAWGRGKRMDGWTGTKKRTTGTVTRGLPGENWRSIRGEEPEGEKEAEEVGLAENTGNALIAKKRGGQKRARTKVGVNRMAARQVLLRDA